MVSAGIPSEVPFGVGSEFGWSAGERSIAGMPSDVIRCATFVDGAAGGSGGTLGVLGRGVSAGGVLGVLGLAVNAGGVLGVCERTLGIVGITNFDGPDLLGSADGSRSAATSPIETHSASALAASIRPPIGGGTGRGAAGISAGRGVTDGIDGVIASRALSSSSSSVLLGASGSTNRIVIPTRPWSVEGLGDDWTISASPSSITPPSLRVSASRPRRPCGSGSESGTKIPARSAYRRKAATNSSADAHADTR